MAKTKMRGRTALLLGIASVLTTPTQGSSSSHSMLPTHHASAPTGLVAVACDEDHSSPELVEILDSAESTLHFGLETVDFALEVVDAILSAHERGVEVVGILGAPIPDTPTTLEQHLLDTLGPEHVVQLSPQQPRLGDSFVVADRLVTWLGRPNTTGWKRDGCSRDNEVALEFGADEIADELATTFDRYFDGFSPPSQPVVPFGPDGDGVSVTLHYLPEPDALSGAIVPAIDSARQSVELTSYALDVPAIVDALIERHEAGIDVRVIADLASTPGRDTELWRLCEAGVDVRAENWRGRQSANMLLVDDSTLVLGGLEWTLEAEETTVGMLMRLDGIPSMVEELRADFDVKHQSIPAEYRCGAGETMDSWGTCFDDDDNDGDSLSDVFDPSCMTASSQGDILLHFRMTIPWMLGDECRLVRATPCEEEEGWLLDCRESIFAAREEASCYKLTPDVPQPYPAECEMLEEG